jgi:hypothetical protein
MPIVAAAIGLLGGLGGALVGGWLANETQERRFEKERAAAKQVLLRETYGTYIGTAQEVWATALSGRSPKEINAVAVRLFVAGARVDLVAENDKVSAAAIELRDVLTPEEGTYPEGEEGERQQGADYKEATKNFLEVARDEIEKTQK